VRRGSRGRQRSCTQWPCRGCRQVAAHNVHMCRCTISKCMTLPTGCTSIPQCTSNLDLYILPAQEQVMLRAVCSSALSLLKPREASSRCHCSRLPQGQTYLRAVSALSPAHACTPPCGASCTKSSCSCLSWPSWFYGRHSLCLGSVYRPDSDTAAGCTLLLASQLLRRGMLCGPLTFAMRLVVAAAAASRQAQLTKLHTHMRCCWSTCCKIATSNSLGSWAAGMA
jgi:hypothetical protein